MIIQNNNCTINNSQIGENNYMTNASQDIDWVKWNLLCQELKQNIKTYEDTLIVKELEKQVKEKNKNSLKKFVKDNYKNFFADILSGIISSNFSDLIKHILFP